MTITEVRFYGYSHNAFITYVSIVLDNSIVINSLKLVKSIQRPGTLMLCMPSRKKDDGSYAYIAHPITAWVREYMQDHIINAWSAHLATATRATHA